MHKGTSAIMVQILMKELLHQDPRAVDLSDGALTRVQFFEPIDVPAVAFALGWDEHAEQKPETFVDPLHREFNELQDRLQKLGTFLIRGAPGVKNDQHELLNMQLDAMRLYHAILKLRLLDLPPPNKDQGKPLLASEDNIGEPAEIGGHDDDRDGPIPFDG